MPIKIQEPDAPVFYFHFGHEILKNAKPDFGVALLLSREEAAQIVLAEQSLGVARDPKQGIFEEQFLYLHSFDEKRQ